MNRATEIKALAHNYRMTFGHSAKGVNSSKAQLHAAIDEVCADAARYRWLRTQNADLDGGFYVCVANVDHSEPAIVAALKKRLGET